MGHRKAKRLHAPRQQQELPMRRSRRTFCAAGVLLLTGCAATAPMSSPSAAIAELGATGKLRAAINFGNPILARRDSAGEPQGVSVDLAGEAARRLGLPVELVL